MPASINPDRARLAARLRELRAATGLSGNRFATDRLRWAQSRVSRIETGTQIPSEADITVWVDAAGAGDDVSAELAELLTRARIEYATWRDTYRNKGPGNVQADIGRSEADATLIHQFEPSMMSGLVQTAAYARDVLSAPCGPRSWGATEQDIEANIAARIQRQQILYDQNKQFHLILGEAVLHTRLGSAGTLLGQLDRLAAVSGLPNVDVGIIPFTTPMPVFPLSGFTIRDKQLVMVETLSGEQQLLEPDEVAMYVRWFDELRAAALIGEDAVALIRRVAAEMTVE